MAEPIDRRRRRFLGTTVMSMAAARFGVFGIAEAANREPPELEALGRAPEWLNSPRLTAASLAGKVVLVDFWTYTCINWLRTLPYRRAWARKYGPELVVIGVHTPEFPFEQDLDNVRRAVRQMALEYPVVIDNDYAIWRAFRNNYWPALYLVDARGRIRHRQFGEGNYEGAEKAIQRVLADAGGQARSGIVSVEANGIEVAADWNSLRSAENYLGYERTANFASPGGAEHDRRYQYSAPSRLALNSGRWPATGRWENRQSRSAPPTDASPIAFMRAICTW